MTATVQGARAGSRLLWAADTVLILACQLRGSRVVADLGRLSDQLKTVLRDFQSRARSEGSDRERIAQATTVLTALLDHVVTTMPWGVDAGWQLLGRHPARQLLDVARAAGADSGLHELIAVVFALGFDGRTHGADTALLEEVRSYAAVDRSSWRPGLAGLSPQWRSAVARGPALSGWLPVWVTTLVAAAILALLFFGLRISLGAKSDRLYVRMAALHVPDAVAPRPLPASEPRLAPLLETEATAGQVAVRDELDRSVIVIPERELFTGGDATLAPSNEAVLRPIAAALQRVPGHIEVIGHTDGTQVPSVRYPSEWELSIDRAHAVQSALRALGIAPSRLGYNGRANVEPASGTASGADGNGRIEIVLLAGR